MTVSFKNEFQEKRLYDITNLPELGRKLTKMTEGFQKEPHENRCHDIKTTQEPLG